MLLNEDFSKRTLVHAGDNEWVPSPMKGVDRRMLFRIGEEKARATSIVRYAAGSSFSRHSHPGGEEFLVLDGTFQDESGDFPVGTYVRNPPGTAHAPKSDGGCTILVKLWQFKTSDRERIVQRPGDAHAGHPRDGVADTRVLFEGADELVMMEDWQADATVVLSNPNGLDLLVVDGSFKEGDDTLNRWSWLRLPAGQDLHATVGPNGACIWYKSAPLLHDDVCPFDAPVSEDTSR